MTTSPPDTDTIRLAVLAELERTGMTRYGLWLAVRPAVGKSTLCQWLAGTTSIGSAQASVVLDALGLTVSRKSFSFA